MKATFSLFILLFGLHLLAGAQVDSEPRPFETVVNKDGKKIVLYSDFTWKYEPEKTPTKASENSKVVFAETGKPFFNFELDSIIEAVEKIDFEKNEFETENEYCERVKSEIKSTKVGNSRRPSGDIAFIFDRRFSSASNTEHIASFIKFNAEEQRFEFRFNALFESFIIDSGGNPSLTTNFHPEQGKNWKRGKDSVNRLIRLRSKTYRSNKCVDRNKRSDSFRLVHLGMPAAEAKELSDKMRFTAFVVPVSFLTIKHLNGSRIQYISFWVQRILIHDVRDGSLIKDLLNDGSIYRSTKNSRHRGKEVDSK